MNAPGTHTPTDPAIHACPTDVLGAEHRVIERVLACLTALAERLRAGDAFDRDAAVRILAFLTEFADRIHHMKEEDRLFPALEQCGLPRQAGPTAVMREEHDIGRAFVRAMAADVDAAAAGEQAARRRFAANAIEFSVLLHEHIAKEDQVLFPMAAQMIPPGTRAQLMDGFARDHEKLPADRNRQYYHALADELCAQFSVTEVEREPMTFGGCGGSRSPSPVGPETCTSEASSRCSDGDA